MGVDPWRYCWGQYRLAFGQNRPILFEFGQMLVNVGQMLANIGQLVSKLGPPDAPILVDIGALSARFRPKFRTPSPLDIRTHEAQASAARRPLQVPPPRISQKEFRQGMEQSFGARASAVEGRGQQRLQHLRACAERLVRCLPHSVPFEQRVFLLRSWIQDRSCGCA